MKTVVRILIILCVAGLVSGGFYLIFNHSSVSGAGGLPGEGGGPRGFAGGDPGAANADSSAVEALPRGPQGEGERIGGGGEHGGGAGRSWLEIGKNLVEIALITAGVVLTQKLFRWFRRRRQQALPPAAIS